MDQAEVERRAGAVPRQADCQLALARLLHEARRLTRAEAGTVFLREGDRLVFAIVQNDVLDRRVGGAGTWLKGEALSLTEPSIARYVALTSATVNIADAYHIPSARPYRFHRQVDATTGYRTRSLLAMPIHDGRGSVLGVLELINALNNVGGVMPFNKEHEAAVATLLANIARITPPAHSGRDADAPT
jgi:hypothetical protein